jgi:hypothetical protein
MAKTNQITDDRFKALLAEAYAAGQADADNSREDVPVHTGSNRFSGVNISPRKSLQLQGKAKLPVKLSDAATELLAKPEVIDPADFVMQYIETNRGKGYAGLHSVYSGLNQAIKRLYPDIDPVKLTSQMAADGLIVIRYVKGGAYLIPADEAIQSQPKAKGVDSRLAAVLEAFAKGE